MPGPRKGPRGPVQRPKNIGHTLAELWRYLRRYRLVFVFAVIMVVLNIGASLAATGYLQPIIDRFLDPVSGNPAVSQRLAGLMRGVMTLGCIYLISVVASYLQQRLMMHIAQNTIHDIRRDLFNHMQTLSIRYFDAHTHGEVMSRFTNDVDTLNDALQNGMTTLLQSVILIVGILYMMITRSLPLTVMTLLFAPVLVLVIGRVMKVSSGYFIEQQQRLGDVNGYIEEMMTGQKVVKVFGYEQRAENRFSELNEKLRAAATSAVGVAGLMMPLSRNINAINYALVATVGGVLSVFGFLSVGGLVVFLQLVQQFSRPITEASGQYQSVVTALAGAERVFELMHQAPENEHDTAGYVLLHEGRDWFWSRGTEKIPVRGDVRFHEVSFGYDPEKTILKNISLFAKPGHKIAFVGSTGAGKTTMINLLTRFYDVDKGSITIDGIDLRDIARESLRRAMAVVLQDTHLFTGTVMENIRYGRPDADDQQVIDAAKLASAHSFIMRLPKGYDTMIEGDGANLSQGQRQLLNIARATVADAPILILDEATSSVDTRTERHIERGLDRLMAGRTTFIIAHRLSTVRESNAILVMEQGEIIERGTHDDLLALRGRYHQLYTGALELD